MIIAKLIWGKVGQLEFSNDEEYYKTLGALCNSNIFHITYESNKDTNSWEDAYRIRCDINKSKLLPPLKKAARDKNRINCNDYVVNLQDNHNFYRKNKIIYGEYCTVIATVPDEYKEDFEKGYKMYL